MRLSLCNEVVRELPFERQCDLAAQLGYAGLEVAPFTLGDDAYLMSAERRAELRRSCSEAGVRVSGLHWLLVLPAGLSITTANRSVWERTVEIMRRLIELCADLDGDYLVHGSPAQRRITQDEGAADAAARGEEAWAAIAADAERAGVVYCIEPLARRETEFVNTVADAAEIVRRIGSKAVRTMIDTSAAAVSETEPVADLIARWMPSGLIAHVQLNDRNRRGPGQGEDQFAPVLAALRRESYDGWIAMEPFDYVPDGPTCAARCIGYVAGILEALDRKT
ncbi:MAG: D-psicose/D-tagatose/L-ribulose 3-epimerase [Variibacter sp.]|jgi:sugar phosphate isomerase/epimerase|nr:D-psicose/D-tagatose/L-ribulose 3-epimerase [Variibacter sp.]